MNPGQADQVIGAERGLVPVERGAALKRKTTRFLDRVGLVERLSQEYQDRLAQWEQQKADYIREHGLAAWDDKVEREFEVLYPEGGTP